MKRTGLKRPTLEQVRAWQNRPRKPIPKFSKAPHKTARRRKYEKIRDTFLAAHEVCQICERPSSLECHHVKGRTGPLLFDVNFFMALCYECHIIKIHGDESWARKSGYLK